MYHFIGIKGSGMSALAQIMKNLGYSVQGSDVEKHFFTEDGLIENNIKILPFDENNIKDGMKIVRGASFHDEHPEVKRAKELNLPMFSYSEMVGSLTRKFKTICIAGCHGKTTTTSMMSHVFNEIKGANFLIGDGTGFSNKENDTFILESCEYRRHFLKYTPYYAIITNIDYKKDGTSFEVFVEDNYYGFFDLPIYGKHMLLDALAVIAVCYYERFDVKQVAKALKGFKGAKRRFTETFVGSNVIIDDYAHHPNEVKATIKSVMQKYPDKKIITIFQPHTFTRTQEFADSLANVMNQADYSYVMPIHPAREKQEDYPNVTSDLIISKLEHGELINMDESDKLKDYKDSVLVFMSPNDISKLENETIDKMKED